eukprot:scaffold47_cov258-Pinguiococcus_pyrenoidosus.AAC.32
MYDDYMLWLSLVSDSLRQLLVPRPTPSPHGKSPVEGLGKAVPCLALPCLGLVWLLISRVFTAAGDGIVRSVFVVHGVLAV